MYIVHSRCRRTTHSPPAIRQDEEHTRTHKNTGEHFVLYRVSLPIQLRAAFEMQRLLFASERFNRFTWLLADAAAAANLAKHLKHSKPLDTFSRPKKKVALLNSS